MSMPDQVDLGSVDLTYLRKQTLGSAEQSQTIARKISEVMAQYDVMYFKLGNCLWKESMSFIGRDNDRQFFGSAAVS